MGGQLRYKEAARLTARVNPTILGAMLRITRVADGRSAAMQGSTYGSDYLL